MAVVRGRSRRRGAGLPCKDPRLIPSVVSHPTTDSWSPHTVRVEASPAGTGWVAMHPHWSCGTSFGCAIQGGGLRMRQWPQFRTNFKPQVNL